MKASEIRDRIGWKENTDIRTEVMDLCEVVGELATTIEALVERVDRITENLGARISEVEGRQQ